VWWCLRWWPACPTPPGHGRTRRGFLLAKATRGDKQSHPAHVVLVFSLSCSCCRCGLSRYAVCVCGVTRIVMLGWGAMMATQNGRASCPPFSLSLSFSPSSAHGRSSTLECPSPHRHVPHTRVRIHPLQPSCTHPDTGATTRLIARPKHNQAQHHQQHIQKPA